MSGGQPLKSVRCCSARGGSPCPGFGECCGSAVPRRQRPVSSQLHTRAAGAAEFCKLGSPAASPRTGRSRAEASATGVDGWGGLECELIFLVCYGPLGLICV